MSIDRRFVFGPGGHAEVFVLPTDDGRALVVDAHGRPLGLVEAEAPGVRPADVRGAITLDALGGAPGLAVLGPRGASVDLFELDAGLGRAAFAHATNEAPVRAHETPVRVYEAPLRAHETPVRAYEAHSRAHETPVRTQADGVRPRGFAEEPSKTGAIEDPERARGPGTGVVRFALLGQIRGALAEALAANHALVEGASSRDRRDTAEDLASAVLQTLGVELPNTAWVPGTRESRTWGGRLRLGEELAERARLPELVQLLLHETGRVHSPRHAAAAHALVDALATEGYLSRAAHADLTTRDDATSTIFAALGAWIFDPAQRPRLDATLAPIEAPEGSKGRSDAPNAAVAPLVDALDRASADRAFERTLARHDGPLPSAPPRAPWVFGDD